MPNLDLRPGSLTFITYYKGDQSVRFNFTQNAVAYPLTDVTAASFVVYEKNGTAALTLTHSSGLTINAAGGYIDMAITNAQIVALFSQEYNYEFSLTLTGGTVWPILDSVFIVSEDGQVSVTDSDINISLDGINVDVSVIAPASSGGGGTWGSITGNLPDQTDLQTALDGKVDENAAITGATKTKITYDAKGLVTAGADAAIADITGLQTALDAKAASSHNHALSDITQSGATTNQVPKWNGSAWVPANDAGGASVTEITYADMATAIAGSTLTPGGWYLITDAAGTDLGFLTNAINENTINVSGVGGYLNADFQAVGDYSGTPETFGTQLGIWRTGFEEVTLNYTGLTGPYIEYTTSSGLLDDGEPYTTDLGNTGTIIHDDGVTITLTPDQALSVGEIITGSNSGNSATVNFFADGQFAAGDTLTNVLSEVVGTVLTDNGSTITMLRTGPGLMFSDTDVFDNGQGVTATVSGDPTRTIVLGDVVIWNLSHYQLTDATLLDGTDPATNTAAYTLLDKATYPETYVTAWDVSEFDFLNNQILFRQDILLNSVRSTSGVPLFQWGNANNYNNQLILSDASIQNFIGEYRRNYLLQSSVENLIGDILFSGNTMFGGSVSGITNTGAGQAFFQDNVMQSSSGVSNITIGTDCSIGQNTFAPESNISGIVIGDATEMINNILENGASLTGITAGANCSISRNNIGQGATLGGSTTMGDGAAITNLDLQPSAILGSGTLDSGAYFDSLILEPGASVGNCTLGVDSFIDFCKIASGSGFDSLQLGEASFVTGVSLSGNSNFESVTLGANASIESSVISAPFSNKTLDDNVSLQFLTLGTNISGAETISGNITGKRAIPGYSDIPGTIDITGLTTLDCTAAWAQYRGIYNLTSSNATEAIDTITNPPTAFPFMVRNAGTGLALTITGTAYAGIGAGQIALSAASYVLNPGEYIILEYEAATGALIENRVVTGLL